MLDLEKDVKKIAYDTPRLASRTGNDWVKSRRPANLSDMSLHHRQKSILANVRKKGSARTMKTRGCIEEPADRNSISY
ncbi:hypothetical protein BGX34_001382, partial [Mortierella sp. NVP85]